MPYKNKELMLIADTGAIYAFYDGSDKYHHKVQQIILNHSGQIIIPEGILAEIDYLILKLLGTNAELDFITDLQSGVFQLRPLTYITLPRCAELINQYRDLSLGLADTIVMSTAEELTVFDILTVDERDFRAVKLQSPLRLILSDL